MWFSQKSDKKISPSKNKNAVEEFVSHFTNDMADLFGWQQVQDILLQKFGPAFFSTKTNQIQFSIIPEANKPDYFKDLIIIFINKLEESFGKTFAEEKLSHVFDSLKKQFSQEEFAKVLDFIPPHYLESERVVYLSREALELKVKEKIKELLEINQNLEKIVEERTVKLQEILKERESQAEALKKRGEELMTANEKLKKLDEVKSEFVSVAAHQLRTPLTGVKWTLDLLIKGDLGAIVDEQKLYLMKAKDSNNRMISLVNDLLNVEKIQFGKYSYNWKDNIQIEDLIESVIFELQFIAKSKHVNIQFERGNTPKMTADPEKMIAVLDNFIENAIKYSDEGGKVSIKTEAAGENIKITISDNGIGIPKEEQPRLFERFFRASNAVKLIPDGSGLGLFISKTIIDKHQGSVIYEKKEGGESTFIITFPAHLAPADR